MSETLVLIKDESEDDSLSLSKTKKPVKNKKPVETKSSKRETTRMDTTRMVTRRRALEAQADGNEVDNIKDDLPSVMALIKGEGKGAPIKGEGAHAH